MGEAQVIAHDAEASGVRRILTASERHEIEWAALQRLERRLEALDDLGRAAYTLACRGESKPSCIVEICGDRREITAAFASISPAESVELLQTALDAAGLP